MKQPMSLLEYALEAIRKNIMHGVYKEGQKLNPKTIAEELNISQTPVKEAFNRLISERLLESIPRRGFIVSSHSERFLRNIIDVRKVIEKYISEKAVLHVDKYPEIMQRLEESLNEMAQNTGTFYENPIAWEMNFHIATIALTENEYMQEMYRQLWNIMYTQYVRTLPSWPKTDLEKTNNEHREIYRCLKDKDSNSLKNILDEHVANMEKRMGLSPQ